MMRLLSGAALYRQIAKFALRFCVLLLFCCASLAYAVPGEQPLPDCRGYLTIVDGDGQLRLSIENVGDCVIWLPKNEYPPFKYTKGQNRLDIWYGYFEELEVGLRSHYLVPQFLEIQKNTTAVIECNAKEIASLVVRNKPMVIIHARLARIKLKSGMRERGMLEKYLEGSIRVDFPAAIRVGKKE